jgi:carboxyl-terminal processing protease
MIFDKSSPLPEKNLSKKEIWLPLMLAGATIVGIVAGMKLKNEPLVSIAPKEKIEKQQKLDNMGQGRIEEILRYVNAKYVDNINDKILLDKSINNLLEELDPHSIYIPAEALSQVNEDLDGEYEGVGIETVMMEDTFNIITPLSNSPAANAGLLPNDKILTIGDTSALGKDMRWLNNKLRGKKGTTIKLSIKRGEEDKLRSFSITRDRLPVHSVEVATTIDDQTGFIKISRFSNNTTREFLQALEKLYEKKNVKNLVIDLRQNPGGYMDKAVDMLSQIFKDKDKLLVYTRGRTVHRNEYKTSGRFRYEINKIAILIDEGSASASEIVAGAVQDWDRGVVVGRRSFGKGLVQEPYILKDGSELRLTVARYFTPSGRSIQKQYKGKTRKQYAEEESRRFESGELTYPDLESQQHDTAQFKTASGRTVYGGGGIQPDIFVPIDPAVKNEYFNQLSPWIAEYAYRYYSIYRKDLKFSNWQDYQRNFRVSDYALNDFIKYSERQGIAKDPTQLPYIKNIARQYLKARLARLLYGDEGYYGILNDNDLMITRALEALKQEDPLGLRRFARK